MSGKNEPWNYSCDDCESCASEYPCPVYKCSRHNDEIIKWTHANCGGSLRLYENGKEKCEKCGVEELFCLWDCSCYEENKDNEKQYSYSKIRNLIAKLSGLDARNCSIDFLIHVAASIKKQYKDHPERFDE